MRAIVGRSDHAWGTLLAGGLDRRQASDRKNAGDFGSNLLLAARAAEGAKVSTGEERSSNTQVL